MDKLLLLPSMMCANFDNLQEEVDELQRAGADGFHLDVMDGSYVNNFALGLQDVQSICKLSHIPCDVHLMVKNPANCVETFVRAGASVVYIHPEADVHPVRTLQRITQLGAHAGIAVDTGVSYETVHELLPIVDYVLVMTVNPGFAGQKYCEFVDAKLQRFLAAKGNFGFQLLIDGACSPQKISLLSKRGVDGFVLGTSALFGKSSPYGELISSLRNS